VGFSGSRYGWAVVKVVVFAGMCEYRRRSLRLVWERQVILSAFGALVVAVDRTQQHTTCRLSGNR